MTAMDELVTVVLTCDDSAEADDALRHLLTPDHRGVDVDVVVVWRKPRSRVDDPLTGPGAPLSARIRWIQAGGMSLSEARNIGLAAAAGEYVVYLSPLDRLLPGASWMVSTRCESTPTACSPTEAKQPACRGGSPAGGAGHPQCRARPLRRAVEGRLHRDLRRGHVPPRSLGPCRWPRREAHRLRGLRAQPAPHAKPRGVLPRAGRRAPGRHAIRAPRIARPDHHGAGVLRRQRGHVQGNARRMAAYEEDGQP